MAITKYYDEKEDKELYRVQVVRKSSEASVHVRKRLDGIASIAEAEKVERRFHIEAERELIYKENRGTLWGTLIDDFELALKNKDDIFTKRYSIYTITEHI